MYACRYVCAHTNHSLYLIFLLLIQHVLSGWTTRGVVGTLKSWLCSWPHHIPLQATHHKTAFHQLAMNRHCYLELPSKSKNAMSEQGPFSNLYNVKKYVTDVSIHLSLPGNKSGCPQNFLFTVHGCNYGLPTLLTYCWILPK